VFVCPKALTSHRVEFGAAKKLQLYLQDLFKKVFVNRGPYDHHQQPRGRTLINLEREYCSLAITAHPL
jgi:hypothetical protein